MSLINLRDGLILSPQDILISRSLSGLSPEFSHNLVRQPDKTSDADRRTSRRQRDGDRQKRQTAWQKQQTSSPSKLTYSVNIITSHAGLIFKIKHRWVKVTSCYCKTITTASEEKRWSSGVTQRGFSWTHHRQTSPWALMIFPLIWK